VRDFPGNYTQYRLWLKDEDKNKNFAPPPVLKEEKPATPALVAAETPKRKLSYKEKREFDDIETQMPLLEKEKATLMEKMSSNISFDELQKITTRLSAITQELEEKEMRWLELSE
jgi:ATP-binding cassette subfamily F protein uup